VDSKEAHGILTTRIQGYPLLSLGKQKV